GWPAWKRSRRPASRSSVGGCSRRQRGRPLESPEQLLHSTERRRVLELDPFREDALDEDERPVQLSLLQFSGLILWVRVLEVEPHEADRAGPHRVRQEHPALAIREAPEVVDCRERTGLRRRDRAALEGVRPLPD